MREKYIGSSPLPSGTKFSSEHRAMVETNPDRRGQILEASPTIPTINILVFFLHVLFSILPSNHFKYG